MVRQYPPQPQPQPPIISPYSNLPYSPRNPLLQNAQGYDQMTMPAQPLPRRYAYPLSRHNSYHSQASGSEHGGDRPKPPEHMLRRKTPNGILAAAYDGTSVEETEKPHATKHILLPVTAESSIPYGLRQELPLRSPGINNDLNHIQHEQTSEWSPSLYFETGSGRAHSAWTGAGQALPQIDSMLNQMPPLLPHPQYPIYGPPFCAAMPPSFQALGPTVSNDQGPFGPYWHDGTFIPYQPAAMRDPRFYPHHDPNWNSVRQGGWHNYSNALPNINNLQQNPFVLPQPLNTYNNVGRPSLEYPLPYMQGHQRNPAVDYQSQTFAAPLAQRPQVDTVISSSGQSTPVPDHTPTATPSDEFGPQSNNIQSRERVFAWAHTVYIDLLKYLQATRKPNSNSRHPNGQQSVRPHIYPKPPRQPGANFSSSSGSNSSTPSSERPNPFPRASSFQHQPHSSQGPTQPSQDSFYPSHRPSHQRSPSAWSLTGGNSGDVSSSRQPWPPQPSQHFGHQHIQEMEPLRPLRRMSGTSVAGAHQSFRHETPPSMTAASALDAITKHCEESKWNWIDGILLGGCLAYALGDYKKAQDWYKHILTLDKE